MQTVPPPHRPAEPMEIASAVFQILNAEPMSFLDILSAILFLELASNAESAILRLAITDFHAQRMPIALPNIAMLVFALTALLQELARTESPVLSTAIAAAPIVPEESACNATLSPIALPETTAT